MNNITIAEEKHTLKQLVARFMKEEGFLQRIISTTEDSVYETFVEPNYEYEASKLVDLMYTDREDDTDDLEELNELVKLKHYDDII